MPVRCGVVSSEIAHEKASVHFVMEEAGKECGWFVWVDFGLCGPVGVGRFDPLEVIIGEGCDGLL